jgi:hypothetical protein
MLHIEARLWNDAEARDGNRAAAPFAHSVGAKRELFERMFDVAEPCRHVEIFLPVGGPRLDIDTLVGHVAARLSVGIGFGTVANAFGAAAPGNFGGELLAGLFEASAKFVEDSGREVGVRVCSQGEFSSRERVNMVDEYGG